MRAKLRDLDLLQTFAELQIVGQREFGAPLQQIALAALQVALDEARFEIGEILCQPAQHAGRQQGREGDEEAGRNGSGRALTDPLRGVLQALRVIQEAAGFGQHALARAGERHAPGALAQKQLQRPGLLKLVDGRGDGRLGDIQPPRSLGESQARQEWVGKAPKTSE